MKQCPYCDAELIFDTEIEHNICSTCSVDEDFFDELEEIEDEEDDYNPYL